MVRSNSALNAAVNAVQEIGGKLREGYGKAVPFQQKSASAADVVTDLDLEAEKFLKGRLASYDASIGFMGEEFGHTGQTDLYWLADPIDGTGHFVRGMPFCTTMICLVELGQVICSVIYNFVTGELFTAERGKGALCNGEPLRVSEDFLSDSYLAVETRLDSIRSIKTYMKIQSQCPIMHTISAGYEFGLVAQGKIGGRICFDPFGKDWDYGPGSLLVTEAGGRVTNIGASSYDFRKHNFIAANLSVHEELSRADSPLVTYM